MYGLQSHLLAFFESVCPLKLKVAGALPRGRRRLGSTLIGKPVGSVHMPTHRIHDCVRIRQVETLVNQPVARRHAKCTAAARQQRTRQHAHTYRYRRTHTTTHTTTHTHGTRCWQTQAEEARTGGTLACNQYLRRQRPAARAGSNNTQPVSHTVTTPHYGNDFLRGGMTPSVAGLYTEQFQSRASAA